MQAYGVAQLVAGTDVDEVASCVRRVVRQGCYRLERVAQVLQPEVVLNA